MFVSRVVVSLRVPGLEKRSLVKITSLVYNCRMAEVYTMAKLVCVLSPTRTALLCSFNLVSKALSVCSWYTKLQSTQPTL